MDHAALAKKKRINRFRSAYLAGNQQKTAAVIIERTKLAEITAVSVWNSRLLKLQRTPGCQVSGGVLNPSGSAFSVTFIAGTVILMGMAVNDEFNDNLGIFSHSFTSFTASHFYRVNKQDAIRLAARNIGHQANRKVQPVNAREPVWK